MMLIMNNLMIRVGLYNDSKWINMIMEILCIKDTDKKIIEKVVNSIMNEEDGNDKGYLKELNRSKKAKEAVTKEIKW